TVAGHHAWYVQPKKPLQNKPWVWRTSFPDWHTEMDSILVSRGFHLFFVDVDNHYGSTGAMQVYDQCYARLVDTLGFSPQPALEAVSRGGLYAYGWAKRNPAKVSCIYAEAPVCDINSWPGGKGKGKGDARSWKECLKILGINEDEAKTYRDIPLNDLDGLAAFHVPLLHVISNTDSIVPPQENTYPLVQRYTALGGPATVYPVTDGPQELSHHHFPIRHAQEWADFIMQNSYPVKKHLPDTDYLQLRNGLPHAKLQIAKKRSLTVAYLGGSITFNDGWRNKSSAWLQERFPETKFRFIRVAIPSLGSLPHAFRLSTDLPDLRQVDLMFVEAAVNDRGNKTDSLTQIRSLEGIVEHAKKANPDMDLIFMSFADPHKNKDYDAGREPLEIHNHERVASYYNFPSVNLAKLVHDKISRGEFSWEYDFKNLHPSPFGQELYFSAIKTLLEKCFSHLPAAKSKTPAKPLDKKSFSAAGYFALTNAKNMRDFKLNDNWTPKDKLPTRAGFVHVPVLEGEKPGASFDLTFSGTAVGIGIVSGDDAGTIEYAVDNSPYRTIDLFTEWSNQLHLPWYL
ncbi:MAG: SGNH/GDSL hydrolase family protein, partial [Mucilaginibacter polytrichastri]|nr:SGNH/GDSL hydrolase family protein [Mucilaginibacter polytrichastri]